MSLTLLWPSDLADEPAGDDVGVRTCANDVDVATLNLTGVRRVDLHFPAFTDGRALTQAVRLRRRLGYRGEVRATGDVLVDLLPFLQRCGFSQAVLRGDQDAAAAQRALSFFGDGHYQRATAVETDL